MATTACNNHPIPGKTTNPRISEVNNSMRRSFSGNPFAKPSIIANQRPGFNPNTPANSPSDYSRRNSIGRENMTGSLDDYEDKENGSLKQTKVRSPASLKGTKNFMSSTISAASKINPSPRKKILTEKNEPVCTSVTYSDGRSHLKDDYLDNRPEKYGLNKKKEVSFDPTLAYLEDKEDLDSNDCLPTPGLAPLDADLSMPPYDPKTNYLSPRPQFLHYKPNPRIEQYLNKERDGRQLEEIFASESSDTEVTEEDIKSDDSQQESESSSSGDMSKEEEEEDKEELPVSEPYPISAFNGAVVAKQVSKPNFFTRTKFTALLFVLAIACLWASVSNSPVMDPSVFNNLSFSGFYVPPEISEFVRGSLEGLSQKFRRWLYESLSYIHNLIISFRESRKLGPLQFANLSSLLEDDLLDNNLLLAAHCTFKHESNELWPKMKSEVDLKLLEEQEIQPIDSDEKVGEVSGDESMEKEEDQPIKADETIEEVVDDTDEADQEVTKGDNKDQESYEDKEIITVYDYFQIPVSELEEGNVAVPAEVTKRIVETADDNINELQSNSDSVMDQPALIPQDAEIQSEVSDCLHSLAEIEPALVDNVLESLDSDVGVKSLSSTESADLILHGNKNPFSAQTMVVSLLVLSLLAAGVFIHEKNQTSATRKVTTMLDRVPMTKKFDRISLSMAEGHTLQEKHQPSSRNGQTDVETIGESCPSEMSSFQHSGPPSVGARRQERKPRKRTRRESMASSDCSMGSPSYGSFTTYEKLTTNKHGNGEEEWATPVRRSSRIRNHVTSP